MLSNYMDCLRPEHAYSYEYLHLPLFYVVSAGEVVHNSTTKPHWLCVVSRFAHNPSSYSDRVSYRILGGGGGGGVCGALPQHHA